MEYIRSLGILGWLLMALNLFTGLGAFEFYTGLPVLENYPTWGWLPFLIVGLLIAPYLAFRRVRNRLREYEDVEPIIVFDQPRESPLYHTQSSIDGIVTGKYPIYHIVQAWFVNSPKVPSKKSIGQGVTAKIEFYDKGVTAPRFWVYGQWVLSTAPNHVGYDDIASIVDMLPNDERHKLGIALKWTEEDECYAYSKENIIGYEGGRNPDNMLPPGEYLVCVKLKGIGVEKSFDFTLVNLGAGADLELKEIS